MSCSENYGHLFVIHYITAPTTQGYQNGTLILGTSPLNPKWDPHSKDYPQDNYILRAPQGVSHTLLQAKSRRLPR